MVNTEPNYATYAMNFNNFVNEMASELSHSRETQTRQSV